MVWLSERSLSRKFVHVLYCPIELTLFFFFFSFFNRLCVWILNITNQSVSERIKIVVYSAWLQLLEYLTSSHLLRSLRIASRNNRRSYRISKNNQLTSKTTTTKQKQNTSYSEIRCLKITQGGGKWSWMNRKNKNYVIPEFPTTDEACKISYTLTCLFQGL